MPKTLNTQELLLRIDYLISKGSAALSTKKHVEYVGTVVNSDEHLGFRTASLSLLKSFFGDENTYVKEFDRASKERYASSIQDSIAILQSARYEVEQGWLDSFKALITAEVFSDFLEMSEHLLFEGYKDASAVMIGSVLEEHLRQLCYKNGIDTTYVNKGDIVPKKANLINSDLKKAGIYGALDEKQVLAWLGIRNSAAHGNYSDYDKGQVNLMYQGVLNFISKNQ